MNRIDRIRSLINLDGFGLEIGPSFNPIVPKSDGFNVEILDHLNRDDLVAKYANANIDASKIEEVDYLSDGASVFDPIGHPNRYDYIVASHVIEHTVDLVGFLKDCERLLKPGGVLALAVPDKRHAFDSTRPFTTTGSALQAHIEKRTLHSPGQIFDEIAYNCVRGGQIAWEKGNLKPLQFFRPLSDAWSVFKQVQFENSFMDIHAWQFSPSSFRLLARDLNEIGLIGLTESGYFLGPSIEFYVGLAKQNATVTIVSREELMESILDEQSIFR